MKRKLLNSNGFTLVEMLVAIAIFAIISGITISTAASVQKNARDGQRKTDLNSIKSALQQYYADFGFYPSSEPAYGGTSFDETMSLDTMGNGFSSCAGRPGVICSAADRVYMPRVPEEPTLLNITMAGFGSNHYCYEAWSDRSQSSHCDNTGGANNCQYFRIYSTLELPPTSTTYICTEPSGPHDGQNFFVES